MSEDLPRPKSKKYLWPVGIFTAIVLVLVFLLPTLLSTSWGKNYLLRNANERFNGNVQADDLSISWLSSQKMTHVNAYGEDGKQFLKVENLEVEASLLSLLFGKIPGQINLKGLELDILPYSDGTSNLSDFLKLRKTSPTAEPLPAIRLYDVSVLGKSSPNLSLNLTGKTTFSEEEGSFRIQLSAIPESQNVKIDADIKQFPVFVLDDLIAMKSPKLKGVLLEALGNTLNITVNQTLEPNHDQPALTLYKTMLKVVGDKAHINLDAAFNEETKKVSFLFSVEANEPTSLVFGSSLQGSLDVDILNQKNIPVQLSIKSQHINLSLDGRIVRGALLLNRQLEGQIQITEQLSRNVLRKISPILGSLVSAENPVAFWVEAEGFHLPLQPFSLQRSSAPLATIALGNLQFRNSGSLGKALSALKPGRDALVSMEFTPLYLHLNNGIVHIERVDMLLQNQTPLAAWGYLDLNTQMIDMNVGLSGYAIAHAFDVQIGDPNAYIAIPLTGTLQDPQLNRAAATSQITSLVAKTQGGAPGKILGAVINIASSKSSSPVASVPPPTTSPLPWEGRLQLETSENQKINPIEEPIKAVSESASKILKTLFR